MQEAMLHTSRALRRDDRPIDLKPWLFRVVRNCCLDELSRVRVDAVDFDSAEEGGALRAAPTTDPVASFERRSGLREMLDDLATLPEAQRHALVCREVDGLSHEPAYCLTGHGMQGGTVEHAIVVAAPRALTRGWSYTALSRARTATRLHIDGQVVSAGARAERADLAPDDSLAPAGPP